VTWDSVVASTKEYHNYMFLPVGIVLRCELGHAGDLSKVHPSISLGLGGVLNVCQKSFRDVGDIAYGALLYPYNSYEYGLESAATFDFYFKPGITLNWNRFYLGYDHHFNTRYMIGSINFGYKFKL
jgi:hypothetical protein